VRPVRKAFTISLVIISLFALFLPLACQVYAAWEYDPEVTEVGKNAERARELLYWVMTHPTDYTNAGIQALWQGVRNFVYLAYVLIIIMVGLTTMVFRGRWIPIGVGLVAWGEEKLGKWIPRLVFLIVFATFSYLITVALANLADLLMSFFIRHYGGCNLFNIKFAGPGSTCDYSLDALKAMEENYQFTGYRETTPANNEAANSALFLVRMTTFTYNLLSIILLLRQIIIWFLIIVSPILALLFPFILIRNVGWIWIGEFLRWLFYGPLVAIFLAGLVQIWKIGIPYGFDFSRTQPQGGSQPAVIFPTAISILIGGPAQGASLALGNLNPSAPISGTNSLNYVDTYAEYIISLIMLWAVILLPFLLLRIFRDFCCEVFGARQETLWAMYDKIKSWGQPPEGGLPPSAPPEGPKRIGPTGQLTIDLPYRWLKSAPQALTQRQIRKIAQVNTNDIMRSLGLAIPSMREIALADMNTQRRNIMQQNLQALARPELIASETQKDRYSQLHQELNRRASVGDTRAQRLMQVATGRVSASMMAKAKTGVGVTTPSVRRLNDTERLAKITKEIRDKKLPIRIPTSTRMSTAQKLEKIEKEAETKGVRLAIPAREAAPTRPAATTAKPAPPTAIPSPTKPIEVPTKLELEEYEEIKQMWINHYRLSEVPVSEKIKSRQEWLEHDIKAIQNTTDKLSSLVPEIQKEGFDEVAAILPFLLLGEFSKEQTVAYLKAKLAAARQVLDELIAEEKIKEQAKEKTEEEELVEVPVEVKKEEVRVMEAVRKLVQELPPEEKEEEEKEKKKEPKSETEKPKASSEASQTSKQNQPSPKRPDKKT
jgi:hypothetical protein